MGGDTMVIASAVLIPEAEESEAQSPTILKRKQSPEPAVRDYAKRARLSPGTQQSEPDRAPSTHGANGSRIKGNGLDSKRRASGEVDERQRGRRLFGAVLGSLGQSGSSQLSKRREIERKQQEKLKGQVFEDDAAREERLTRLRETRIEEQVRFDRESMRIRHSNLLAAAHALQTTTEPRLYYRPWLLKPREEIRIKEQVQDAEDTIVRELAEAQGAVQAETKQIKADEEGEEEEVNGNIQSRVPDTVGLASDGPAITIGKTATSAMTDVDMDETTARKEDADEGGEDMDGEDAVLY